MIKVNGKLKKELLTKITYEFDKIHESYPNLTYTKLVPCNCSHCHSKDKPYLYQLEKLIKRIKDRHFEIECEESYERIDIRSLVDDVN